MDINSIIGKVVREAEKALVKPPVNRIFPDKGINRLKRS
jgi:hypothetical protein